MYIATIPNRSSPPAILLREGYREGGKVKTRTLCNLSKLPPEAVAALRRVLKGDKLVEPSNAFEVIASPHHGHVKAVRSAMRRVGFDKLIGARRSRERDLVEALVVARILEPDSKLATTRWWHTTTLPQILGVADADEQELYAAMDWLLARQGRIEKKLAARHLAEAGLVLYDLSSSYFEGVTCPLASLGYSRDGKRGKLQVNYGVLTDVRGCPVSISVFKGNTTDSETLLEQVKKMRERFAIVSLVIVGDRGMITQKQIDDELSELDGVEWITALKSASIRKLVEAGHLQLGLFDERNLFELAHPDFPGERLVACRNPQLAKRRAHKRQSLLAATTEELEKVRSTVQRAKLKGEGTIRVRVEKIIGKRLAGHFELHIAEDGFDFCVVGKDDAPEAALQRICNKLEKIRSLVKQGKYGGKDKIGVRVGKVVNKYKVAKHFVLDIAEDGFDFHIDAEKVAAEAALDGIYVLRTSLPEQRLSADDVVRNYKNLSVVERAFRCIKTIDLNIRPIRHHLEKRVRAHIFLCMLAYYVEWHMREAWRPLLFCDEDQQAKKTRDPVAPAKRSAAALRKTKTKVLDDGTEVHSFQTLLKVLSTIVRNLCRMPGASADTPTFEVVTTPNAKQQRAYDLLETITL